MKTVLIYTLAVLLTIRSYLFNLIYLFLDVGVNTLIGGHREESISSRAGKGRLADKPVHTVVANVIDFIFFWEPNHCTVSIQYRRDTHAVSTIWDRQLTKLKRKF